MLMIRTSLFWLWISNATCLAQTPNFSKVISTKKGTGLSKTYRILPEDITPGGILPSSSIQDKTKSSNHGIISQISAGIRSTFLPSGYPKSTPPGYLQYSIWSWIQDLSSQLRSVLATQRVLEGVGVGRQGATALSALLNFLVRDGCGMGANLLFTSLASSSFSTDGKRWRIFADIMVDIGLTLEVCATMVPGTWFLPMICTFRPCQLSFWLLSVAVCTWIIMNRVAGVVVNTHPHDTLVLTPFPFPFFQVRAICARQFVESQRGQSVASLICIGLRDRTLRTFKPNSVHSTPSLAA